MNIGISTSCFYPETPENAIKFLCENGVENIEFFVNSVCETKSPVFDNIKAMIKSNGTKVSAVHPFTSNYEPFMVFSKYQRRFEDAVEFSKIFTDVCNQLECDIIVFHGDKKDSSVEDQMYFERYFNLYNAVMKNGVYLAQENVCRCRSKDASFVKKMHQSLNDNCAFVLDLKQARRSNENVSDYFDAMGDRLKHIHLSDYGEQSDCTLPSENGMENFKNIFDKALNCSFSLEVYRENYNEFSELLKSRSYLECLSK